MKTKTPIDLYFDQLLDLLSVEEQLQESFVQLPSLCEDAQLRQLVEEHGSQTSRHHVEIKKLLKNHAVEIGRDVCKAMEGLIEGGEAHLRGVDEHATRDLMMVAHCLRVEHYETAAYEITRRLAERLGLQEDADLLGEILTEEQDAANLLLSMEPRLFEKANR